MQVHKYKYIYKEVLDVTEEGTGGPSRQITERLKKHKKIQAPKY